MSNLNVFVAMVDIVNGTVSWDAGNGACDLCRREEELYRLLNTTDALCQSCFAMWHG